MFIGKTGMNSFFNRMDTSQSRNGIPQIYFQTAALHKKDRLELGRQYQQDTETGIYHPNGNQMRAFSPAACTQMEPDSNLQKELLPPSERSSYTEDDALLNQYMKQSRIDGYFDGNLFVRTSSKPVKLILQDAIAQEDLAQFRSELVERGLDTEIDWQGVRNDLTGMAVGFDNVERFQQKSDYLSSRYAVLKDRIQAQFTGGQQEAELQKLEQLYTEAKEKMADSYAERIGGFYEEMGQSGAAAGMRESVLAVIDGKAEAYALHLAEHDLYAELDGPDQQWLKQDDAYMASRLRNSAAAGSKQSQETAFKQAVYSERDLVYAGVCAKELSQILKEPAWDIYTAEGNDSDLGKYLAEQCQTASSKMEDAGISGKLSSMLKHSFAPFMERFMDALDRKIDQNRAQIAARPWQAGTVRTSYIDRSEVYGAFQTALSR